MSQWASEQQTAAESEQQTAAESGNQSVNSSHCCGSLVCQHQHHQHHYFQFDMPTTYLHTTVSPLLPPTNHHSNPDNVLCITLQANKAEIDYICSIGHDHGQQMLMTRNYTPVEWVEMTLEDNEVGY